MDLRLSEEQRLFADAIDRLLERNTTFEQRRDLVSAGAWGDAALWRALADQGCFLLAVPDSAGGLGAGAVEVGLLARAIGRHILIEPVREAVVTAALLAAAPDEGDLLGRVAAGKARLGLSFDRQDAPLRAVRGAWDGDGLLMAAEAGLFLADRAALDMTPIPLLDDTIAADVAVAAGGFRQIAGGVDWTVALSRGRALRMLMLLGETLGTIDAALAATTAHVRERRQFGGPLSDFQTVQHRVAEMVVAAREAEAIILLATLTFDAAGPGPVLDRAMTGAVRRVAVAAGLVADSGVQLHGGMGVSDESPIAAHFRRLQAFAPQASPSATAAIAVVASGAHRRSAVLTEA